MALWKSQMEDHISDWLRVVSISGLGQTMNGRTYRCVLCYRLGVPLFSVTKPCLACSRVFIGDIYGDHAVSCAGIVGIKHRHNVVRDTFVDICYRSGISSGKEVDIGLSGERDKSVRPADVLLYSWDGGRDVCVDLTGSSPLTQTEMVDFVPGHAVLVAAQRKRAKYEIKCADIGYGFLPFSFSSFGELEKDAVTLLKRIRKFSVAQDIGARAAIHIFSRICFAIAKGTAPTTNSLALHISSNERFQFELMITGVHDKVCILTTLKHCIEIVTTIIEIFPKDEEVVHEHFYRFFDHVMKDSQHAPLESSRNNTSIGARDTGFGRGKRAKVGFSNQIRRNSPAGPTIIMAGVDINTLTMEQYLALTRGNQAPGVVKPEIGAMYCPSSKTVKQLEEIRNFKQEGDETLYQAWERGQFLASQALTAIHTMAEHSQKWHDGSSSKNVSSNSNSKGINATVSKLYSLGRDMKKLKPSLEELMNKHLEESTQRRAEMEEWLTKEFHAKAASEVPNSSVGQCKAVYANDEARIDNTSSNETKELYRVSFIANDDVQVAQKEDDVPSKVLPCQLPPKELNPRSFTLPCAIGSLNLYVMADLGESINVMPKSMFKHLKPANLKKTNMPVEMADMAKKAPIGIVKNILVKIDKPFLATIHAEINVFNKEISLGIGDDRVTFDMDKKIHDFTTPIGKVYMVNSIHGDDMHARCNKKARIIKPDTNIPNAHSSDPLSKNARELSTPTRDPTMKLCNEGNEIYGVDEQGTLKY
ncbi:putative reverse transcriptase domain-containing protein [Tanacetum coccineum]